MSVLQTHLSYPFFSLGHSFISPTSDFRKTIKQEEKDAFVGCSYWCGARILEPH